MSSRLIGSLFKRWYSCLEKLSAVIIKKSVPVPLLPSAQKCNVMPPYPPSGTVKCHHHGVYHCLDSTLVLAFLCVSLIFPLVVLIFHELIDILTTLCSAIRIAVAVFRAFGVSSQEDACRLVFLGIKSQHLLQFSLTEMRRERMVRTGSCSGKSSHQILLQKWSKLENGKNEKTSWILLIGS